MSINQSVDRSDIYDDEKNSSRNKSIKLMRAVMLLVGVLLLVYGIYEGDFSDIMNKAIRICYECIGIG